MGQLYRYWLCQPEVKAYNESMGSVDLVDQICRFYKCTNKLSCQAISLSVLVSFGYGYR